MSDHLEVLYDLDIEARRYAENLGLAFARTEMPNTDPAFVSVCLDTGHYAYRDGDPVDLMRRHPDRIPYLHIKTVDAAVRQQVEADDLSRIVDCLRRLRDAKARAYTKEEVPFITGIRKDLLDAVRDLA